MYANKAIIKGVGVNKPLSAAKLFVLSTLISSGETQLSKT